MSQITRRDALRSGGALALAASIAGCLGGDDGGTVAAVSTIPGVEDGEIVDSHALANAHADELAERSARLTHSDVIINMESGDAERHSFTTVLVEGEQVYAEMAGRHPLLAPDADRMEVYFDEDTRYSRRRSDGEWSVSEIPQGAAYSSGDFTGENTLEIIEMSEVGTETVDDEELYRFGNTARVEEDGQYRRVRLQALIDEEGLVHDFQQTADYTAENERYSVEWMVDDIGETTVEEPNWVADVDD